MIKNLAKFLVLLLFISTKTGAQNNNNTGFQERGFTIKKYTTENGLTNNEIHSIVQDNYGFIWVASPDGISQFDGNDFKTFNHEPNVKNTLPNYEIMTLKLDESNQLWIHLPNSLYRFDRSKENFIEYSSKKQTKLKSDTIYSITNASDRSLWVFGNKGISKFDKASNSFIHYNIHSVYTDPLDNGILWIDNLLQFWVYSKGFLYKGLIKKLSDDEQIIYFYTKVAFDFPQAPSPNFAVNAEIIQASDGSVFLAGNRGLYYLNPYKAISRTASLEELQTKKFSNVNSVSWADDGKGLFIYSPSARKTIHLDFDQAQYPECCLLDHNGILWFGGINKSKDGNGLNMVNQINVLFNPYFSVSAEINKLNVFSILKDSKRNLWVGSRDNNFIYKQKPGGALTKCNIKIPVKTGSNCYPGSILEDNNNNIWVGYNDIYLEVFNPDQDNFSDGSTFLPDSILKTKKGLSFKLLVKDKNGSIYGGGKNLLLHFDPVSRKLLQLVDLKNLDITEINSLCIDKSGFVWIGNSKNIFRFSTDLRNPKRFLIGATSYQIMCITEEKKGENLWMAFLGGGICSFNPKTGNKLFYTTRNGLVSNTTYHILQDNKQNLWISTNHGISCFNLDNKSFSNYSFSDGLKIIEFNHNSAFSDANGEMIFGGSGGIAGFYPDSLELNNKSDNAKLLITKILSSGNEFISEGAIYEVNQILFPRGTNNFKINFSCIDFIHNEKITYRYRLKGYETDWIITDSRHRVANYSSLHPGSFVFEVESTDKTGRWANHTELSIKIPAWFYETLVFKLAMILTLAIVITWFVNFRFRQMQLYERRKQEQLKLESLRGQMNPHFTFNSLNAVNYFISINDQKRANEYISDLSRLMRSILTNARNEFIPLELEINNIKDYLKLEHLRFSDKFDFKVNINEELFYEGIKVAPFLVQPFAENAILHGLCTLSERKGFLNLNFEKSENSSILCYVEDNGIGRDKSEKMKSELEKAHQSRGIELTIERLNIMNSLYKKNHKVIIKDLYPDNDETGTCVIIEIPYIYQ